MIKISSLLTPMQGARPELVAELRFDIPAMYVFHKETSKDVAVRDDSKVKSTTLVRDAS